MEDQKHFTQPQLTTLDLLRMRAGVYKPKWAKVDPNAKVAVDAKTETSQLAKDIAAGLGLAALVVAKANEEVGEVA